MFPHLTCYENVAFGLRASGIKTEELKKKVEEICDMVKINHLLVRYPKNLSGGEKQLVGLARSIITKPSVLLLDEPIHRLDPDTADRIRTTIHNLHNELKLTILYVTHNHKDVEVLSDRVITIRNGKLV